MLHGVSLGEKETFLSSLIVGSTTLWLPWTWKSHIALFLVHGSKGIKSSVLIQTSCAVNLCAQMLPGLWNTSVSVQECFLWDDTQAFPKGCLDEAPQAFLWGPSPWGGDLKARLEAAAWWNRFEVSTSNLTKGENFAFLPQIAQRWLTGGVL